MIQAQAIEHRPLTDLLRDWHAKGFTREPSEAVQACLSACHRGEQLLGLRNTCLVRSLVLLGLLGDRPGLRLQIGFRPAERGPAIDGHAWVTLDDAPLLPADANTGNGDYRTSQTLIPFR